MIKTTPFEMVFIIRETMKRIAALFAAVCLLLSGCGTWMEGSYVSVTPYLSSSDSDGEDIQWISDKDQLYEAVRYMVSKAVSEDIFFVRDYSETAVNSDMILVRYAIMNTDPLGAYAVQDVQFELGINGGRSTLAVKIDYSRQKTEILRMKTIRGREEAQSAVAAALSSMDTELVFYVEGYEDTDFAQMVEDYARENPDEVIETPRVSVSLYPASGENRVVELSFGYQNNRDALRAMQTQVKQIFESAKLYISGDESDYQKLYRLYVFLIGGVDVDRLAGQSGGSITPAYSLLRYGVGDSKAFSTVYAAMCRQVGVECLVVSGTRNGEAWFWNIVKDGDRYVHVDVLRCALAGYFRERSDGQMDGYVWDYLAYPACEGEYQPPTETTQEQTEQDVTVGAEETTAPPEPDETEQPTGE